MDNNINIESNVDISIYYDIYYLNISILISNLIFIIIEKLSNKK